MSLLEDQFGKKDSYTREEITEVTWQLIDTLGQHFKYRIAENQCPCSECKEWHGENYCNTGGIINKLEEVIRQAIKVDEQPTKTEQKVVAMECHWDDQIKVWKMFDRLEDGTLRFRDQYLGADGKPRGVDTYSLGS